MAYIVLPEASRYTGIPVVILKRLCENGQVNEAVRFGRIWAVPETVVTERKSLLKMYNRATKLCAE